MKISNWENIKDLENCKYKIKLNKINKKYTNGWIINKQGNFGVYYLGSNMFTEKAKQMYEEIFEKCGFDIVINIK